MKIRSLAAMAVVVAVATGCSAATSEPTPSSSSVSSSSAAMTLSMLVDGPEVTNDYTVTFDGTPDEVRARVAETVSELTPMASPNGIVKVTVRSGDSASEFLLAAPEAERLEALTASFSMPVAKVSGPEHVGTTSSAITKNQCESDTCGGYWESDDHCGFGYRFGCGFGCFVCMAHCYLPEGSTCGGVW
jgi:hypothetical protein